MSPKDILVAVALLLAFNPANAERGYYSAPRGGAGHRAGAFYGNGPVTADPSRGYRTRRHTSHPCGYSAHPQTRRYRDYSRRGGSEGPEQFPDGARNGPGIEFRAPALVRPYNPYYHGHDRRRRELERNSGHYDNGIADERHHRASSPAQQPADE